MTTKIQRTRIFRAAPLLLVAVIAMSLPGCKGREQSAAAPSGVPNTPQSTEQTPENRYDCVPNEAGDGWDCTETG